MCITKALQDIKAAQGTNEKIRLLTNVSDDDTLKAVLRAGHDPFTPFHVVKVPKVKPAEREVGGTDTEQWTRFLRVASRCNRRVVTGNAAIEELRSVFCTVEPDAEKWMRKVLKKHMALGASTKTINKAIPGLVPTFEVQLAQKFEEKRISSWSGVCVEPKLDGIRCLAIVRNGEVMMYARSGKPISNFMDTIGRELTGLGDGCYDGEIMGQDFIDLMRQAYRKDDVDVSSTYMALFDYLPLAEWDSKEGLLSSWDRYQTLATRYATRPEAEQSYLRLVERTYVDPSMSLINELHNTYISEGYEGAMVKDPAAPYRFGRGYEVMKLKAFHDVDLTIEGFVEGTGKHEGKLGSVIVTFDGVQVQVGSGFSDELRGQIWADQQSFLGRTVEIRYQEVTPDGSLRFPTFKCFRNDRD